MPASSPSPFPLPPPRGGALQTRCVPAPPFPVAPAGARTRQSCTVPAILPARTPRSCLVGFSAPLQALLRARRSRGAARSHPERDDLFPRQGFFPCTPPLPVARSLLLRVLSKSQPLTVRSTRSSFAKER